MRNLDQKRAQVALNYIDNVPSDQQKDYGSAAKSLSMMVQTNGLAQTLAFLKSKAPEKPAYRLLSTQLSDWLNENLRDLENPGDFLDWIVDQNSGIYRRASSEAIEFSIWLRRFVEAQGWE
ncbi:type III-B CRISPR module-associated protein Cmr5 [Chloroflexota bacterium]|nr:type III-B CRISPR module-associated protein Cmr5 [Chloroflexota bacterium]